MVKTRLLLLDDHTLFRESLSRLLDTEPDFQMAAHCATSAQALKVLAREPIDLVLLDYDLGEESGFEFIRKARDAGYVALPPAVTTLVENAWKRQVKTARGIPIWADPSP